jgi:acyl-CoA synthetase (AMP-forming)/AMP-acid ligase II
MLVDEIIAGNARRRPTTIGWRFGERALSWREIDERVNRMANALLDLGLVPGDRVALMSENSHQLAELYFAIPRAGLIVVPVNPLSVRREIEYILRDVGARALLVSRGFVDKLQPVGELSAVVEHVLGIEADAALPDTIEQRLAAALATPPNVRTTQDAVRAIKYTSGTTGTPKGCISTQHQFLINIINYLVQMPFTQQDRCLLCLPMTAGVGIAMLTAYSYLGLETEIMPRFNAARVLDTIAQRGVTRFFAVPTLLAALADEQAARPRNLSSLRLIGYGGQAAAASLILRVMDTLGCGLYQVFGASEAGGFITYLTPADHERLRDGHHSRIDSLGRRIVPCGREVQAFHLRIVDAARNEVPNGEVGELAVFGDSNMSGYWNRPEQSAEVIADGWLYTGDLALRDDDGLIYVVDRKRDMIVSGGLNVYSAEVEATLTEHPAIAEIAVIGVADPYWGERVQAYVVLRDGEIVTEEALLAFAAERLAGYKRPKRFIFVAALPKTSSGKLRKVELREMR